MSCFLRIQNLRDEFTLSELKISEYILERSVESCDMTAEELATETSTSQASVIRFAKKLGYSGFLDFKIELARSINQEDLELSEFDEGYKISGNSVKICEDNIKAIEYTSRLIDLEAVDQAIDLILKSDRINIVAGGNAYLVGLDLEYKLVELGKAAVIYKDPHIQEISAGNLREEDLVIAISQCGKNENTLKATKEAKKNNVTIISITKFGYNPLSDISDIRLFTSGVDGSIGKGSTSFRMALLTVIDIIYINLLEIYKKKKPDLITEISEECD